MTRIIEKRHSLHKKIACQDEQNKILEMQIGQLQALANLGITTCMIAHEINNLLTPLSNYANLALNNPDDNPLTRKTLEKTAKNCQKAAKIMESILKVGNGRQNSKASTNIKTLTEEIFDCLCRDFAKDNINVAIQIPDNLTAFVVPVEIQQVLMNLILNARDALLPKGGCLSITAAEKGDFLEIKVTDTGCGIDPQNLDKIFVPFFSTKKQQAHATQLSGTGLGLAFCKKIIDAHNGSITVNSTPNKKTTFEILLPKSG